MAMQVYMAGSWEEYTLLELVNPPHSVKIGGKVFCYDTLYCIKRLAPREIQECRRDPEGILVVVEAASL